MTDAPKPKTILRISDHTREFLNAINFPEIPEDANYVVFFDDGEAMFVEEFNAGITFPRMVFVSYYDVSDIEIDFTD